MFFVIISISIYIFGIYLILVLSNYNAIQSTDCHVRYFNKLSNKQRLGNVSFPKSYNLSLDFPPYLVLYKMADKISMNHRCISANTPKSNKPAIYLSQRYIPNNVTLKRQKRVAFCDRCQPSARPQ